MKDRTTGLAAVVIPSLCIAVLATSLCGQRIHRFNPTFAQVDPDGFINGEPPDTSNWPHPAAPDGNPFPRSTASLAELEYRNAKIRLGKLLFWEEQMSSDNTMACGTCHSVAAGGTDIRPGALAGGLGGSLGVIRQHQTAVSRVDYGFVNPPEPSIDRLFTGVFTPTMIGAYVFNIQFWNGRDGPALNDLAGNPLPGFDDWAGLEDQAEDPPVSEVEMGHEDIDWASSFVQQKLNNSFPMALVDPATIPPDVLPTVNSNRTYRRIFDDIFQNDPDPLIGGIKGVTRERIAMSISHYERSLIPDQAPIDVGTMTPSQIAGFNRMRTTGCFGCHSITGGSIGSTTPVLTANNTLTDAFDNPFSDGDRHNIQIGTGTVKTPTLRNLGLRQRFFSDGSRVGFTELMDLYDAPGRNPPLGFAGTLTQAQRDEVIDFMAVALTDPRVVNETFPFDRPELASERPEFVFESNEFGVGTPGPSNLTPEIIANAPPLVTGPAVTPVDTNWFKVGVGEAVANAPAFLLISDTMGSGPVIWVGPPFEVRHVGDTNSQGIATAQRPIPLNPSTVGMDFFVQWSIIDNDTRTFSNAAKFTPFQF